MPGKNLIDLTFIILNGFRKLSSKFFDTRQTKLGEAISRS